MKRAKPIKVDPSAEGVGDGVVVFRGQRIGAVQRRRNVKGLSPWQRHLARERGELPPIPNEHLRNNRKKHDNSPKSEAR